MGTFTPDAERFLTNLQDQYMDYLCNERGVTSVREYFDDIGADNKMRDPGTLKTYLSEQQLPLELLYQVAPASGQPVALVSTNPGMPDDLTLESFSPTRHYGRHAEAGSDVVRSAELIARHLDTYLSNSNGFSKIIPELLASLDELPDPEEVSFEDYIGKGGKEKVLPLFEDIYYTRAFKLPTPRANALSDRDREFARKTCVEELRTVADPTVIICTGELAWKTVYEMVENPDEEIIPLNESVVSRKYSKYTKGGARGGLYRIPEMETWVITVRHGGYPPDMDRLKDNLERLNKER